MIYMLCALLGATVLGAIALPLLRRDDSLDSTVLEETEWDLLLRRKEVILGNIQDLDFEFKCGKLSEADYQQVRSRLSADGEAVLVEIDRLEAEQDLDALIRQERESRRSPKSAR